MGRADLSPYLIHLTRDYSGRTARENLLSIVSGWEIEARNAHGSARELVEAGIDAPTLRSVCLSETPLGQLKLLSRAMPGRQVRLAPYGVILAKDEVVRRGGDRVWYTNMSSDSPGRWISKEISELITAAVTGHAYRQVAGQLVRVDVSDSPIARIAPFIDWVVPGTKDFTWEREWRVPRTLYLGFDELRAVVVPTADISAFTSDLAAAYGALGHTSHNAPIVGAEWAADDIEQAIAAARRARERS